MKKYIYGSCSTILILLFACNKQLDQLPVSSVQTSNFYTNTNDFQQAVNGVYTQLKAYPDQTYWMGELRSDNIIASSDGNRDWQGINDFSPNLTTTAFIVSAWDNNFNGVYNANTVLDALNSKGTNVTDTTLRRRFGAECRFLRAFYYFQLVRLYGKVPVIDRLLSPDEVAKVPRGAIADVYNLIISDLQYSINFLPATYSSSNDIGRPTLYSAKALLGLVYLTRSGPTYTGVDGPTMNSAEYDKAAAMFTDVINSGQYVFSTTYPSIFAYTNENNKEVVFDVQFMTTTNGADYPGQLVPPAYWTGLGLSGYDNGYGTASYNISKNLLASYRSAAPAIDVRDTFNINHGFALSTSTPTTLDTTRPFIKKYIDISRRGTGRADWPVNFIAMRYTDVLMMKAECILHGSGGTQADVDAIVNQVRKRAGLTPLANVNLATLMEERRKEFLGEGLRWNDLVREGMAVTTMNAWIASDAITTISAVVPNYIIYPVPQAELLAVPGLYTQNAGYN